MRLFKTNGTRVTKSTVPTADVPASQKPLVLTEDLMVRQTYGANDPRPDGSILTLGFKAGTVLTQQQINNLFDPAKVTLVEPAQGPAAGGTTVTITGEFLDGVTSVTFDGAAGNTLNIVSERQLTVKTPAGSAGPADIALVDDSGTVTKVAAYTYV
jgi:hypothetical protein